MRREEERNESKHEENNINDGKASLK